MDFIGRTKELEYIIAQLDTTKQQRQCTALTLVADTGVGKSRLVQEFYNQITQNDAWDPAFCNYWPDAFQTLATQLHVTPTMTNHVPDGPPRFLWFGLRWHDPQGRHPTSYSMLPLLLDQLETHAKIIQSYKEIWKQYLDRLVTKVPDALTKAAVDNVAELLLANFIPGANLIVELVNILRDVGHDDDTGTSVDDIHTRRMKRVHDELLNVFRKLCGGKQGIPIVIWLDDAQWMDKTSYNFFRVLHKTAVAAHWPIYIIATCWPDQWAHMPADHFLKKGMTLELSNPPDDDLRDYLKREFPGLSDENIKLIIYKSADNYLGLIENIGQLKTTPRFFVDGNFNNPLSDQGIRIIERWEGNRAMRIAQRFSELDDATKDVLARASYVGQSFLIDVIHQFAHQRNIAHTDALIRGCINPLVLINQLSPHSHVFRDRGYYFVAQQHFSDWLQDDEINDLLAVLTTEVGKWVHGSFGPSGEVIEQSPLSTLNYADQQFILKFALHMQSTHHDIWLRGIALMIERGAQANDWEHVHTITQLLNQHDWKNHDYQILDVHTCEHLIMHAEACGNIAIASQIATELVEHHRILVAQSPTTQNIHDLTLALNNLGNSVVVQDLHEQAIVIFEEDAQLQRQLYAQTSDDKYRRELSVVLNKLGNSHSWLGNKKQAKTAFQESVAIMEDLANQSNDLQIQRDLSFALLEMAQTLFISSQPKQAAILLERAILIRQQVVQSDPTLDHQLEYAFAVHKRGYFTDNYNVQLEILNSVLETHKQVIEQRGTISDIQKYFDVLIDLGDVHFSQNNYDQAVNALEEASNQTRLIMNRRGIISDISRHRDTLFKHAGMIEKQGQMKQSDKAAQVYQEALQTHMTIQDPSSTDKLAHVRILCGCYYHSDFMHDQSVSEYLLQAMTIITDLIEYGVEDDIRLNFVNAWYTTGEVLSITSPQDATTFLTMARDYMKQHNLHKTPKEGKLLYEAIEMLLEEINLLQ
jgi:tetratricopeptide (TPR) repeat protein